MKPIVKIETAFMSRNRRIVVDCDSVMGPITATISQIEEIFGSINNRECVLLVSEYKHIQIVNMAVILGKTSDCKYQYVPCNEIRLSKEQKLNALDNAFYYDGMYQESNISPKYFNILLSEFKPDWKERCKERWRKPYTLLLKVYKGELYFRDIKDDEYYPINEL